VYMFTLSFVLTLFILRLRICLFLFFFGHFLFFSKTGLDVTSPDFTKGELLFVEVEKYPHNYGIIAPDQPRTGRFPNFSVAL